MRIPFVLCRIPTVVFAITILTATSAANAQITGGGFGVGGGIGGGGTGVGVGINAVAGQGGIGQGGIGAGSGVIIDTDGLMKTFIAKNDGKLAKQRIAAAEKILSDDLTTFSPLRKVSLVRLERACEEFAKTQTHVTPDMQYLAGLQRIDFLFVYPEENDIVIAGPAEGFAEDGTGRAVGITTGRPPLRLDDLIVALRAQQRGQGVGCSIDARPENLAKLKKYQAAHSGVSSAAVGRKRFQRMAKILGKQDITIWGVPPDSHFARTMVEADYIMKRVSAGLFKVRVKGFKTQLELTRPGDNIATRWWFAPSYEPFTTTSGGDSFQFAGQRVQLWAENEIVTAGGKRIGVGIRNESTDRYTKQFTKKFPELAKAIPAFAELQTLIDLLMVATVMRENGLAERAGWSMELFLDPGRATIAKWNVPREVDSVLAMKRGRRRMLLGMIGGGVVIDPVRTFREIRFTEDKGTLDSAQEKAGQQLPADDRWWWD